MDLAALRIFLAVAQERSFSRAAAKVHRTQPAVSQAVRRLEVELGEQLFDRSSKSGTLTEAGRMCSDKRQEFILFSDTLGLSMVVDLISHRKPDGATESTVFGPFHRLGAPELPAGGNIAHLDKTETPTLVSGRVLDLDGKPIEGALLDVWQAQTSVT